MVTTNNKIEIFNNIKNKIEEFKYIVIFHHTRPDGDCLGAQNGLKQLINDNYPDKKVFAIGDKKNLFDWLNYSLDEIPSDEILAQSLAIVVDASYLDRIQCSELLASKKLKEVMRIDHHLSDDDLDASLVWNDPEYIATCEEVAELAIVLKWKISKRAAEFLFLGLSTDSGRFIFKKTSPRTFEIAAELLKCGIIVEDFYQKLYQKNIEDLSIARLVFNNYVVDENIIYFVASDKLLKENNLTNDLSQNVNLLSNIKNFYIWIFFIEDVENNNWRINLRSNGPNVNEVAKKFNGGGHLLASGANISDINQLNLVIEECKKEIIKWKK